MYVNKSIEIKKVKIVRGWRYVEFENCCFIYFDLFKFIVLYYWLKGIVFVIIIKLY